MADVLSNRASFTLAAAITSATQTSITRTSATDGLPGDSNGPASGTYVFEMTDGSGNYELARVTGGQGTTTLTIARAVELIGGTQTALASVPSGTVCYAVATAGDLALPSSYDETVLTKLSLAPVAYWKLDDPVGSTTAADSSGNGYTLTVSGTVTFGEPSVVPSDSETSAKGDGSTGYLSGAAITLAPPLTIIACVNLENSQLVAANGVAGLDSSIPVGTRYITTYCGTDGTPYAIIGGTNFQPGVLAANSTHLIGVTVDPDGSTVLLDGMSVMAAKATVSFTSALPVVLWDGFAGANFSTLPTGRVAIFAGVLTPKDWALLMQAFTGV